MTRPNPFELIMGVGFRDSGFGFRIIVLGFRVSWFESRVSVVGYWDVSPQITNQTSSALLARPPPYVSQLFGGGGRGSNFKVGS